MKFQFKPLVSFLLVFLFAALILSGAILYISPRGRVANWTGWTMLGLEKHEWQSVHVNAAAAFLLGAAGHLWLNWSAFFGYVKSRGRWAVNRWSELLVSLLVAVAIFAGAVYGVWPFGAIIDGSYRMRDYWDRVSVAAPSPHAEELSIAELSESLGLPTADVLAALRQEGIRAENADATMAQVAAANARSPAEIHAAIQKHFPEATPRGKGPGQGRGQGRGRGRGAGRFFDD